MLQSTRRERLEHYHDEYAQTLVGQCQVARLCGYT